MLWKEVKRRQSEERRAILMTELAKSGWRLSVAAEALGVGKSTLQGLIDRHGLRRIYAEFARRPGRPAKND